MEKNNRLAAVIIAICTLLIALSLFCKHLSGLSNFDLFRSIYYLLSGTWYGPVLFILFYTLSPLVFFPPTFLTILAGILFGMWEGLLFACLGENFSANLAFLIGRMVGKRFTLTDRALKLGGWRERLRTESFIPVLVLRLLLLPFDLINYFCGAAGVKWKGYALGTFAGTIPTIITFVSFGSSVKIEQFLNATEFPAVGDIIDSRQLCISMALLIVCLIMAKLAGKKSSGKSQS